MRKTILINILLTLLIALKSYGQSSYRAIYKVKYNNEIKVKIDTLDEKRKKVFINVMKKRKAATDFAEKAELVLDFNSNSSLFYLPGKLEVKKGTIRTFRRIIGFRGKYYVNSEKIVQKKNSFGEDFLVSIPKPSWDITSNSKKIDNYTCYKATTIRKIKTPKGDFDQIITAWFTPELPFNYGPKEFQGLPGLIIHLQQGRSLFYLKSIKKNKKIFIKEPKKGKEITVEDFENLSKKMFESLRS